MRAFYAIGGGNFLKEENRFLDEMIIRQTQKERPKLLYIASASFNERQNIQMVEAYFTKFNVEFNYLLTADLNTFPMLIDCYDIIYFGAGTTAKLVALMEKYALKKWVLEAYKRDKIIVGISAGAIMLFEYGFGDQFAYYNKDEMKGYRFVDGLGILKGIFVPHYQNQGLLVFHDEVKKQASNAFVLEDMTALKITDNQVEIIKKKGQMVGYFDCNNDYIFEPLSDKKSYSMKLIKESD